MASNTSQLEDYLNQRFVRGTNARLGNDPGFAQYVAKQTASRPINPNSIKDVKTLQSALRTKQINPQQFQSQFYKINNFKTPTTTSTSGFNTNNIKQFGLGSAITAAKQLTVDPIVTSAKDTKNQAVKQFQHLAGPTATGQQRQALLNNQAAASKKPAPNLGNQSAAGTVQIQKMIAQGKSPKEVKAFARKDAQGLDTQTKKGINAAVTLAPLGAGALGTASRTLLKTGVTAALGKDEGVNALVNAQRAARATQTAKAADIVGSTATKEAKTTRIPVVGPTQTAAARTSLGSTAMDNVGRSTVPVVDKSTPVAGKVVAPPKNYIAKSTQLSKQYDKEVAGLQNVPSPHAQQVLQSRIDAKYAKLQQDLDTTYGQTKVAFTGKPTGPRSAFTQELENNAKTGPYTPPDAVTGSPAGTGPKTTKIPVTNGEAAPAAPQVGRQIKWKETSRAGNNILEDMKDPAQKAYRAKAKGEEGAVVKMHPDEYIEAARQTIPAEHRPSFEAFVKSNSDLPRKSGEEYDMPYINKVTGNQDGMHRAVLAKSLGEKEIPVLVVDKPGSLSSATRQVASASSTGVKPSGPSMREASRAIEAGMKSEPEVTGFEGVSHKVEAQKAAKLVDENPDKAYKIATGAERGDNVSHDRAVYHAVTQKEIASAHKTGDWSRVQELVAAPGHKEVSEAGQTLGAEGYHMNPHDPVKLMQDLVKVRKVVGGKRGVSVAKEAGTIEKTVKETVGRVKTPDWDSFVESLRC